MGISQAPGYIMHHALNRFDILGGVFAVSGNNTAVIHYRQRRNRLFAALRIARASRAFASNIPLRWIDMDKLKAKRVERKQQKEAGKAKKSDGKAPDDTPGQSTRPAGHSGRHLSVPRSMP
ncbi:MAG: hypothetical protein U5L09_03220 [Bacteroidales bacterium]|nr:hypothetical protein [Bacteroidales bacterium]